MDRNSSVSMLALTDEDVQNYGQPHFEAFLRNFVAKNEYFGEQIGQQIRAELFDFYVNKYEHKEEKDRNAEFFLRLYSMVRIYLKNEGKYSKFEGLFGFDDGRSPPLGIPNAHCGQLANVPL